MRTLPRLALLISTSISAPAMAAWDGTPAGVIQSIDVSPGENYGFRVHLHGVSGYCNATSYDFAYLNESDSNYKTFVAALMAAKVTGSTVQLYLSRVNGACKIGFISIY